jgi:hypothetical protein
LIAVPQQRPQIAELRRRHPDRRKAIFRQQVQEQDRVSMIVFLSACFDPSNLRGIANLAPNSEFLHQSQKPSHRSSGFNAYDDRRRQARVEVPHRRAIVRQGSFDDFPGFAIQHRDRLLARMQIAAYNPHLGLLRPERCEGGHRTVYAGRREADVVMTSSRRRHLEIP